MKFSETEKLLARLAVGFHSQLRYYRGLESCGMDWVKPVRERIEILHRENIDALNAQIAKAEAL
jgi:hypothetical protein